MRIISALLVAALAVVPAAPVSAEDPGRRAATTYFDRNDDVLIVPFGYPEESRTDEGAGDIRRVVTTVGRRRVRVAVSFDGDQAGYRLEMRLNFAARGVSGGRGFIAALTGNMATGKPTRSFSSFYAEDPDPGRVPCAGLRTQTDPGRWVFSVPVKCLRQKRKVGYQEISIQTKFLYDDATAYDEWPRRGAVKIR